MDAEIISPENEIDDDLYSLESGHDMLDRANPAFTTQEWDNGSYNIQNWLERTAQKRLVDTDYGRKKSILGPSKAVLTDPLLNSVYKMDIATFLTAERISMVNMSKMISFAPDENSQVFLATQSIDEARHYEVFCRRLADIGMTPVQREDLVKEMTLPKMKQFYDLIDEQVDKKQFVPALLAHNVVLEGMVYPLYRYEIKYWSKLDPALSSIVKNVFADEVQHVSFGEAFIAREAKSGLPMRNKILNLAGEFHQLMNEVFDEVIDHAIGLYQASADMHAEVMADVEIFPGHKMRNLTEEDQTRLLQQEIQSEYQNRLQAIGLG